MKKISEVLEMGLEKAKQHEMPSYRGMCKFICVDLVGKGLVTREEANKTLEHIDRMLSKLSPPLTYAYLQSYLLSRQSYDYTTITDAWIKHYQNEIKQLKKEGL